MCLSKIPQVTPIPQDQPTSHPQRRLSYAVTSPAYGVYDPLNPTQRFLSFPPTGHSPSLTSLTLHRNLRRHRVDSSWHTAGASSPAPCPPGKAASPVKVTFPLPDLKSWVRTYPPLHSRVLAQRTPQPLRHPKLPQSLRLHPKLAKRSVMMRRELPKTRRRKRTQKTENPRKRMIRTTPPSRYVYFQPSISPRTGLGFRSAHISRIRFTLMYRYLGPEPPKVHNHASGQRCFGAKYTDPRQRHPSPYQERHRLRQLLGKPVRSALSWITFLALSAHAQDVILSSERKSEAPDSVPTAQTSTP